MRRIDVGELAEWQAYYQLEPWGEERADLRAGIVAATVANCNRAKNSRAYKPQEFMPDFAEEAEMTVEEMLANARAWALATGGEIK